MRFFTSLYFALALLMPTAAFAVLSNADKAQNVLYQNYAPNPGAESGTSGWTASAGTFTTTTTAANVARGAVSFSWDGSATGQTLTSTQVTIPSGLYGTNCLGRVKYKTTESTVPYVLEVIDGSSNVLASATLNASSSFIFSDPVSFNCPSSSTFALRVRTNSSAGNPAIIYLDEFFLGGNHLISNVSNAVLVGTLENAATASCAWSSSSSSYADFSADSDCPTPSVTGAVTAPGTKVPHAVVTNAPPGTYLAIFNGSMEVSADVGFKPFRMIEGTSGSVLSEQDYRIADSGAGELPLSFHGTITITTAQTLTFKMQCKSSSGACSLENSVAKSVWTIYRFPTSSQQALNLDQVGWRIDANIAGANPDLGTSDVTSYTGITNGSLTMTQNAGSATAWIPCSSTNDASGTTCAAGSESVGVSFTIPYAGTFQVCSAFSWQAYIGDGSTVGGVHSTFQLVETPNTAQTISQEGKERVEARIESVAPATLRHISGQTLRVCGNFTFTSVGRKTVRLFYEQDATAVTNTVTLMADADATSGQRDIHFDVIPIERAWPSPVIMGGVSTTGNNQSRIEHATVAGAAITNTCSSNPCTVYKSSSSWLTAVARSGTGDYALTIAAGTFSDAPSCVVTVTQNSTTTACGMSNGSDTATAQNVRCARFTTEALIDVSFKIVCIGPK